MSYLNDPRVFYAIERTLLAWIRTDIAVLALAFLIKKLGREGVSTQQAFYLDNLAYILCILVILMSVVSFWQCTLSISKLGKEEFPTIISKYVLYATGIITIISSILISGVVIIV